MNTHTANVVLVSAIVVLFLGVAFVATAADVSGTLEINKKKFNLSYGYIDMLSKEELRILLSDKPVMPEQAPILNENYALESTVHAVLFKVSGKDKKLSSELTHVYFGGDAGISGSDFPADKVSLDLKQTDNTLVEGKIKTSQPVKLTDLTYSFDASFKLSTKAALAKLSAKRAALAKAVAPKKVSFSGDDSAPVKPFKEYYKALMAGDFEVMKKYLSAEFLKELGPINSEERKMGIMGLLRMSAPEQLKIEKPSVTGDRATFKASGKEGSNVSTGSIKMVIENGTWKLGEQEWESVSK